MNTVAKFTLSLGGACVLFAAGLFAGARLGAQQFVLLEGSVKASLLAGELSALRSGAPQKLIHAKELELDAEIVKAIDFQEGGQPWLLWSHSAQYEHARYLKQAAAYRRQHPSPVLLPQSAEFADHTSSVKRATDKLLKGYGG